MVHGKTLSLVSRSNQLNKKVKNKKKRLSIGRPSLKRLFFLSSLVCSVTNFGKYKTKRDFMHLHTIQNCETRHFCKYYLELATLSPLSWLATSFAITTLKSRFSNVKKPSLGDLKLISGLGHDRSAEKKNRESIISLTFPWLVTIFLYFLLFQGNYFLFIELTSQLHRTLVPIPVWLFYLLDHNDRIPSKVLGVMLTAAYMVFKGKAILGTSLAWKSAATKLLQSTVSKNFKKKSLDYRVFKIKCVF